MSSAAALGSSSVTSLTFSSKGSPSTVPMACSSSARAASSRAWIV